LAAGLLSGIGIGSATADDTAGNGPGKSGKAPGKDRVGLCHVKGNGDYKFLQIPIDAALGHIENHEADFLSDDDSCRLPPDCPAEVDQALAEFPELTSPDVFVAVDDPGRCNISPDAVTLNPQLTILSEDAMVPVPDSIINSIRLTTSQNESALILGPGAPTDVVGACAAFLGCRNFTP